MSVTEWAAVVLGIVVTIVALGSTTIASIDADRTSAAPLPQDVTIYRPECRAIEPGYWADCSPLR
jgi:hypothetical protein